MTDDELDRALFALPLETPSADLRARILSATVERPRLTFEAWEIWAVGTLIAFMVWMAFLVTTSVPDVGGTIARELSFGIDRLSESLSPGTLVWTGMGLSFVIWVSVLTLPVPRRGIADR